VEGINKGRSYSIHAGKNFIGSGDGMDIQILGDTGVYERCHAIIAYDDKEHVATLLPGESRGLVYLEGVSIYVPAKLEANANVEVGVSKLMYFPCCGEKLQWR
jgi:hypothetical protein